MSDPTAAKPAGKPGSTTPKKDGGKMGPVKKWGITILIALFAVVVAFGVGYLMGSAGTEELEAQAQSATRQARLLEARRRLDLANLALENRNFGIAEAHLRAAAQKLDSFAGEDGRIGQLARDVAETQIGVTEDMSAQKAKIRAFITRFDEINPPGTEPSATPAD